MNNMTWLELYNFLHKKANGIHSIGSLDWNSPVKIYDAMTGDESNCDTYYLTDNDNEHLVLMTNFEEGRCE
jgi:hypothetical protein